jgi:Holliday junction resolvase RusA-like endonuclease
VIRIVLAGAVMGKQRPRFTQAGQQPYTPQKTVHYEARLAYAAQQAMAGRPLLSGPLRVDIDVRMAVPVSKPKKWQRQAVAGVIRPTKKPDIDNVSKFIDALNLVVWSDDAQIVELSARKFYSESPALIVTVEEIATGVFA